MHVNTEHINLIITGVGGQGNILISRLVGQAFLEAGYTVTIGETYGATQRGGSVASHVRITKAKIPLSPITPKGKASIVLGLEPLEALRIIAEFGNQDTKVVTNIRPIYPLEVAIGEAEYPSIEAIEKHISTLRLNAWYINASQIAIDLGSPLLANIVMVGALIGTGILPLKKDHLEHQIGLTFKGEKEKINIEAFRRGINGIRTCLEETHELPGRN